MQGYYRGGIHIKSLKGLIIFGIISGTVAVTSISYSIAAVSYDVRSNSYASSAKWKVAFSNLSSANIIGKAIENNVPYVSEKTTSINNINVKLNSEGDEVDYTFDVTNKGNFDASIRSVNIPRPKCSSIGSNSENDAKLVCDNIKYELTYSDGKALNTGDTLYAGETKQLKLRLYYNGEDMPSHEVLVEDLAASIVYSQK